MSEIFERIRAAFSPSRIGDYLSSSLLPDLVVATFTLLGFWLVWLVLRRVLAQLERTRLDETARSFIVQAVRLTVFIVAAVSALGQLGIDTSALLASLGVAGLTLGFAARDTLSNLISGIFIFWDRPFVVGDLVEIGGNYGRVEEITLRSTRVVTVDGRMLAIPNSDVVNSTVASYTNFPNLRLDIQFTVGVEEDLGRIRRLLLDLVKGDERYLGDPGADVVVEQLNDYNVAMVLRVWLKDERAHIPERFSLRERVFETLREAKVEMPYETIQLAPVQLRSA